MNAKSSELKLQILLMNPLEKIEIDPLKKTEMDSLEKAEDNHLKKSEMSPLKKTEMVIQIGSQKLFIYSSQERLEMKYTNEKYEDFEATIEKQTYEEKFGPFLPFLSEWSEFLEAVCKKKIQFNIEKEDELELSFEFMNVNKKNKKIKKIITIPKKEQSLEQKQRKQIIFLKADNEEKQKKLDNYNDCTLKKLKEKDQQIQNIQKQSKNHIERLQKKLKDETERIQKYWKDKICEIQNKNRQNIPIIKSMLLNKEGQLDRMSNLALPPFLREQIKDFRKRLQMHPKYLISVFGVSNAGKSTLMNQLMENNEQMKQIYQQYFDKKQKIEIFPTNKNSYTFYDTFYCFHQDSNQYNIAKGVKPQEIFHIESFKEESSLMTLFVDDKIKFQTKSDLQLGKEHQNGRSTFVNCSNVIQKQNLFEKRCLILRYNKDIFASKDQKYSYLNRYLVLVDRTGINDQIFEEIKDSEGKIKKQMEKLKNDTVLYCMHGLDFETSDKNNKNNMLALMKTHDFEKIIMCINQHNNLMDSGVMQQKDRLGRIDGFFYQIFERVPKHICYLLGQHVKNLKKESENVQNNLSKKQRQRISDEADPVEKQLNQIDKTLRLQINKYKDQLQKFKLIEKEFSIFSNDIRKKIKEKGIDEYLEKEILTKIKKYPFSNVHIFGLENYALKFTIIKQIKQYSNSQLYQTIGVQSLNSIQKYYYHKSQKLNQYQNQLEQYYTSLPIFLRELNHLKLSTEEKEIETLKKYFESCIQSLIGFVVDLENKVKFFQEKIEQKRQIEIGKALWELLIKASEKISKKLLQFLEELKLYKINLLRKRILKNYERTDLTAWQKTIQRNMVILISDVQGPFVTEINRSLGIVNQVIDLVNQCFSELFPKNNCLQLKISFDKKQLLNFAAYKQGFIEEEQNKNLLKSFFQKVDKNSEETLRRLQILKQQFTIYLNACLKYKNSLLTRQKIFPEKITFLSYLCNKQSTIQDLQNEKKKIQDAISELQLQYSKHLQNINFDMVFHSVKKEDQERKSMIFE